MSALKSDFINVLSERGFIYQASALEALDDLCSKKRVTAYAGYDATAPSLHVGNLLSLMMLYWLQFTGHRPIVLLGGTTSLIGDPSGKLVSRPLLTDDTVTENMDGIRRLIPKLLVTSGSNGAIIVNNSEWLVQLNYIQFLRDVGRHFSVNKMLSFDSVKTRLEREQHISFLEFNYMIIQGYDFIELYRRYGCQLQLGGADQWGNMLNGIELGRRNGVMDLFALSCPLLVDSLGVKMGKSADGAVWICDRLLSPYEYWQYWRNTKDEDVGRFLRFYTTLPLSEVNRIAKLSGVELNDAKKILATEATSVVHGREAAEHAAATSRKTFEEKVVSYGLPTICLSASELINGVGVLEVFVRAGLTTSNSDTRRRIADNVIFVNGVPVLDARKKLTQSDMTCDNVIRLSCGRKKHALVKLS